MKTRSAIPEPPNIAAIVKARHHALTPSSAEAVEATATANIPGVPVNQSSSSNIPICGADDSKLNVDGTQRSRSDGTGRMIREAWSAEDRRLFFHAVRLYGRNFTEITRFIRSRGHRVSSESGSAPVSQATTDHPVISGTGCISTTALTSTTSVVFSTAGLASSNIDGSTQLTGRTREQVRLFYWQTWQKIRRYLKFPECVPQHVREVYALINYSVLRTRIKKPLDHRLGEKLNELVHCGLTAIRHNGRRYLLRTPACPVLKKFNNITAPPHEFLLPEDIWVELVPQSQADLWRVLEAEQNPRVRLRVDINRQLSDVLRLVENKWQLATERMQSLFDLPVEQPCPSLHLSVRIAPTQSVDGAIRLQEVPRVRSVDVALRCYIEQQTAASKTPSSHQTTDCTSIPDSVKTALSDLAKLPTESTDAAVGSSATNVPSAPPSIPSVSMSSTLPTAELDVREVGKRLVQGVMYNNSRDIKLLTIYLALGCPERIRFEYSFVPSKMDANSHRQPAPPVTLLYRPPQDLEGHGISNGLRRLLHLNASDYLLHRDWLSSQSVLNKTAQPSSTSAKSSVSTSPMISSPFTPPNQVPRLQSPIKSTQAVTVQNLLVPSACLSSTLTTLSVSPVKLLSTLNNTVTLPGNTTVSSTNVVLLSTPISMVGRVPVVERHFDPKPQTSLPVTTSSVLKIPISRYTPIRASRSDSLMPSSKPLVSIVPRLCSVPTTTTSTTTSITTTAPTRLTSISTIKAHNIRRREIVVGRRRKRLHEEELARLATSNRGPEMPVPLAPKVPIPKLVPTPLSPRPIATILPFTARTTPGQGITTFSDSHLAPSETSDINIAQLLDPGASNQSSLSVLSNDTFASLLNSICQPNTSARTPAAADEPQPSILASPANGMTFKREEEEGASWLPFLEPSHLHASTPSFPPESPGFGDISLTDSMAAAVLETHRDEADSRGLDNSFDEFHFKSDFSETDAQEACGQTQPDTSNPNLVPINFLRPTPPMSASHLLRLFPQASTDCSADSSTIDLNTLLQSVSSACSSKHPRSSGDN